MSADIDNVLIIVQDGQKFAVPSNVVIRLMTHDNYLALSDLEKNNGFLYLIKNSGATKTLSDTLIIVHESRKYAIPVNPFIKQLTETGFTGLSSSEKANGFIYLRHSGSQSSPFVPNTLLVTCAGQKYSIPVNPCMRQLTMAEYDALTTSEQNNGFVYLVNQVCTPVIDIVLNELTGGVYFPKMFLLQATVYPENATNTHITWSAPLGGEIFNTDQEVYFRPPSVITGSSMSVVLRATITNGLCSQDYVKDFPLITYRPPESSSSSSFSSSSSSSPPSDSSDSSSSDDLDWDMCNYMPAVLGAVYCPYKAQWRCNAAGQNPLPCPPVSTSSSSSSSSSFSDSSDSSFSDSSDSSSDYANCIYYPPNANCPYITTITLPGILPYRVCTQGQQTPRPCQASDSNF